MQNFRYFHEYIHQLYEALGYLNDTKALPDLDRPFCPKSTSAR